VANYQIGCFCRPWNKLNLDEFLAGAAGAGYEYAGFMRLQGDLVVKPGITQDDVRSLGDALTRHGLKPSTAIVGHNLAQGVGAAVQEACEFVDAMAACGVDYYLSCGTADEAQYDDLYAVLREACCYARDKGVTITLKPHGGISATILDLIRAVERVDHASFGIYFDPGNIIYYTGGDPLADLGDLAPHVVGICVKDSLGGHKGDVNLEPGVGDVDFPAVFAALKASDFAGPVCVECLGGEAPADINARAARVRQRIDGWLA